MQETAKILRFSESLNSYSRSTALAKEEKYFSFKGITPACKLCGTHQETTNPRHIMDISFHGLNESQGK